MSHRLRNVLLAAAACVALSLGVVTSMSSISASVTNTNTAGSGSIVMRETLFDAAGKPTETCDSWTNGALSTAPGTCSNINNYGGSSTALMPGSGEPLTTKISITNRGPATATSFTLVPADCVPSATPGTGAPAGAGVGTTRNAGLCTVMRISITSGATEIFSGTAAALAAGGPIDVMSKLGLTSITGQTAAIPFTITVTLDSSVTTASTYNGGQISQPLTWSLGV